MKSVKQKLSGDINDGFAYNKKVRSIRAEIFEGESDGSQSMITSIDNQTKLIDYVGMNEVIDPACDPLNPVTVKFSDIAAAAFNIRDGIIRTECTFSHQLSKIYGLELYFKKEFLQITGSFKERGGRYALLRLTQEEREKGVVAASAGNHALALCYHGEKLEIPVTVVMPVTAPLMKISLCRTYGATVIVEGVSLAKSRYYAMRLAAEKGLKYINGYDHPDVIAGQGTIGLEVLEQVRKVDAIIVPIGGGGLIAGVALAVKTVKPDVIVVGVESEVCSAFKQSYEAGSLIETVPGSTLADGLAVSIVGANSLATSNGLIDELVTVTEKSTALAILRLLEMEKSVVEGGGAVGLAAIIEGKLDHLKGKRVVSILSGGNIDTTVLGRTIERGLAADSRLVQFYVIVSDRPGGIAELTATLAQQGASIKDIFHERAYCTMDVFAVRVRVVIETRDRNHAIAVEEILRKHYKEVSYAY